MIRALSFLVSRTRSTAAPVVLAAVLLFPTAGPFTQAQDSSPSGQSAAEEDATGPSALSTAQLAACHELGLDPNQIARLSAKPLYRFNEAEVNAYLRFLHATESDIRRRVVHLARKNLGQPYEIFLLGELPFEAYDPQPI